MNGTTPSTSSNHAAAPTTTTTAPKPKKKKSKNTFAAPAPVHVAKKSKSTYTEKQFILRVPDQVAQQIREMIKRQDDSEKESDKVKRQHASETQVDMKLEFTGEEYAYSDNEEFMDPEDRAKHQPSKKSSRTGKFKIGDTQLPFHFVDLPCVVEAYKSLDTITYYKAGDIHQMFVVKNAEDAATSSDDEEMIAATPTPAPVQSNSTMYSPMSSPAPHNTSMSMTTPSPSNLLLSSPTQVGSSPQQPATPLSQLPKTPAKYKYQHGLTPSTKNIRYHWTKNLRRVTKRDVDAMLAKYRKLVEEDDPENVTVEILSDDDSIPMDDVVEHSPISQTVSTPSTTTTQSSHTPSSANSSTHTPMPGFNRSFTLGARPAHHFGTPSTVTSNRTDDDDSASIGSKRDDETSSIGDGDSVKSGADDEDEFVSAKLDDDDDDEDSRSEGNMEDDNAIIIQKQALDHEIRTLRLKLDQQRNEMAKLPPNPFLRQQYQKKLDDLEADIKDKDMELKSLVEKK